MFFLILALSAMTGVMATVNTTTSTNETVTENQSLKCPNFKVYAVNNTLNIPYTVTCCLGIVFAFYFIVVGKVSNY